MGLCLPVALGGTRLRPLKTVGGWATLSAAERNRFGSYCLHVLDAAMVRGSLPLPALPLSNLNRPQGMLFKRSLNFPLGIPCR